MISIAVFCLQNFKMPLRCHFLHFGITVNGNIAPKIITGSWSDAKGVKVAEKPQKIGREAGGGTLGISGWGCAAGTLKS